MKTPFLVAFAAIVVGCIAYVGAIAMNLGTVPIPQSGWVAGPEVARQPSSGSWLGFKLGEPRLQALANACRLIAVQKLDPVDFKCLPDNSQLVGTIGDSSGWSEAWTFRPRQNFWERHCFGVRSEQLNIFIKNGRIDGLNVDCGVIDL